MTIQHSEMSQSEIEAFLQAPRFAVMGTNRINGPPQLTPVWYLYEGDRMYLSMSVKSAKYKNLRRDPRASICVASNHPDARGVILSGTVELFLEGNATWVDDVVWRLVRRYYDNDKEAQLFMDSAGNTAQSVLAALTPEKIIAQDYN